MEPNTTKKKCVFVLEDNNELRELFTYLLEEEQFEVTACPTAKAFHELIAKEIPDMVILDVMLPDGNGLDICCELKEDPRTSDIPVMIMSAHAHISDMKKQCPAEEFISKPMDIYDFVSRVERHVQP